MPAKLCKWAMRELSRVGVYWAIAHVVAGLAAAALLHASLLLLFFMPLCCCSVYYFLMPPSLD